MRARKRGFSYTLNPKQLREYGRWPVERRLAWLYQGNLLRRAFPKKVKEIQDKFRAGLI